MSTTPIGWPASRLSTFRQRFTAYLAESEKRLSARILKLADKRIPNEWLFAALGALALAAFLFILFFDPYRR